MRKKRSELGSSSVKKCSKSLGSGPSDKIKRTKILKEHEKPGF
jgi:hypothetical protein